MIINLLPRLRFSLLFICFFFFQSIYASTYYVATNGNDGNTGTSQATAFATLQKAADEVTAGDSVIVSIGSYAGFDLRTGGTASDPIVFLATDPQVLVNLPNTVTTDGINVEGADYVEINGFTVNDQPRNGIRIVLSDNCIVRNNSCDNNFERGIFTGFTDDILIENNSCSNSIDEHGIYFSNSGDNPIIRNNICFDNNVAGIHINSDLSSGGDGIISNAIVYGNIIYNNGVAGGAAINMDGVQNAFVYNNVLYNNHATGIAIFQIDGAQPAYNATIIHNTIIHPADGRWCILIRDGSTGAKVINNILINQHAWRGSIAIEPSSLTDFESNYNLVVNSLSAEGDGQASTLAEWQSLGYDLNSQIADAPSEIFMDPSSDFRLVEGSQPIDIGNGALAQGVDKDILGNTRPIGVEHDIGAYEKDSPLSIVDKESDSNSKKGKTYNIYVSNKTLSFNLPFYNGEVWVYSIDGKLLFKESLSDKSGSLDLQYMKAGIYFFRLEKNGRFVAQEVFVIR